MKRCLPLSLALTLSLLGVLTAPQPAAAAPLPAAYSGAAGGDIVAFDLNLVGGGVDLADARYAVSQSTVDGGATPTSEATASNLAATVAGLGIAAQSNTQTAPPDNPTADTGTIAAADAPGLLTLGALTTTVQARAEATVACTTDGGVLADSLVESAGSTVNPTGVATVFSTGDSSTRGVVALVPSPAGDPLNRAVQSTATGEISGTDADSGPTFLNGAVEVGIDGASTLQATATGEPGGASVTYDPGVITVTDTVTGETTTLDVGESRTVTVPGGEVTITANPPTITEAANGQTATGTVSVVTAEVRVGPAGAPIATSTVDLLPLRAEAVAPPGGIDCPPPPPVLQTPADGSETTDTTPTFTGTAVPGAEVEIVVDGTSIGTTTADEDGNFSFTPTTPLDIGPQVAVATQTTPGGTSAESNENAFTIVPPDPVLQTPADGSETTDTTPTFTGTAVPGSTVTILVDGDPIGTTTADDDGNFSFTPTTPLDEGDYEASATATVNGVDSGPSNVNDFSIVAAAAPVLQTPADGTVTDDTTPTFTGTAVPGSTVTILVDGDPIGTTTADDDGNFSFTPTTPLDDGDYEASATATVNGVDSGPSNVNDFTIDTTDPAAPVITSPEDGDTITDTTPVIRGTGEPGATVTVSIDGDEIGTDVVSADGTFAVPVTDPLAPGDYTVTATQTDPAGNTSPADAVDFTVAAPNDGGGGGGGDETAPDPPVITSPTDGSTTTDATPPITGTAEPGSQVIIVIDGEEVGSTVADDDGNFTFVPTEPLSPGDHDIQAIAVDDAGNRSEPSDLVTVTVVAPSAGSDTGSAADPGTSSGADPGTSSGADPGAGSGADPGTGSGATGSLADTGGPVGWIGLLALVAVIGGATMLITGQRRRRRTS